MSLYYSTLGKALGYPSCCVNEFIERYSRRASAQFRKLCGSGFVPCKNCDANYTEDELIVIINKNRSKDLPPFSRSSHFYILYNPSTLSVSHTYDSKVYRKHLQNTT